MHYTIAANYASATTPMQGDHAAPLQVGIKDDARLVLPQRILDDLRLVRVMHAIESDHDQAFTLDQLAAIAGISASHFDHVFKSIMGESVFRYIRRTRLEKSAIMLFFTDSSILYIATLFGYSSAEPFNRAFHRRFGMSPRQFRKKIQGCHLCPGFTDTDTSRSVEICTLPGQVLIGMRTHYQHYEEVDRHWLHFHDELTAQGIDPQGMTPLGLCLDVDEVTEPGRRRYTCGVIESGPLQPALRAPLFRQRLPAGRYARLPFHGPRKDICRAANTIGSTLISVTAHELAAGLGVVEHYIHPPWLTAMTQHTLTVMMLTR